MKGIKEADIDTRIVQMGEFKVRRIMQAGEWWFAVEDLVAVVTDNPDGGKYWRKLQKQLEAEGCDVVTFCHGLKLSAPGGKHSVTDCTNAEGFFRIIQSISTPKAESFKRWLAKGGSEQVQEIENPELAMKRARLLYTLKGYSDEWIQKRMRGIAIQGKLTDEWQRRGAVTEKEQDALTAEISKAAFGVTPSEYKEIKGLKRENLRDHMDDFELIFTMLGERSTTEIHREEDSRGVSKLTADAKAGGKIAGDARKALEKRLKRPIVSSQNYLRQKEGNKRLKP